MGSRHARFARCPHCGKAIYPSFRDAQRSATDMMRLSGKTQGLAAYWSKPCRAYHVGHSTAGAYRKARWT